MVIVLILESHYEVFVSFICISSQFTQPETHTYDSRAFCTGINNLLQLHTSSSIVQTMMGTEITANS